MRADFEKIEKEKAKLAQEKGAANGDAEEGDDNDEENDSDESDDLNKLDDEIEKMKDEERRKEKRKKKKTLKEKRKIAQRIDLKMIIPGDEGPKWEEDGLFQVSNLKTKKDLDRATDQAPDALVSDSDSDEGEKRPKVVKYSKDDKNLDQDELRYKGDSESEGEDGTSEDEDDSGKEDLDLEEAADDESDEVDDAIIDDLNNPPQNPLLMSLVDDDKVTRKERKANMWFDKDIFKGIEDDEDLEESDVQGAITAIRKKGGKVLSKETKVASKKPPVREYHSDSEEEESKNPDQNVDESDSDSSSSDEEQEVNTRKRKKKEKKLILTPEELALGQEMIKSKKARRDIMDSGWNRFMFDDKDANLPAWFVREEEYHMRRHPDVDPSVVEFYKDRQKDVNVKTIKKVVEAKARKKRKLTKRMDKAKKRASAIMENADLGTREKANEIKKLYKKAAAGVKKPETKYVVAKKFSASARAKRPAGVKGPYKQVDPRMKKDNQKKRSNATSKRIQKRRLKGKKTKLGQQG